MALLVPNAVGQWSASDRKDIGRMAVLCLVWSSRQLMAPLEISTQ